MHTAVSVPATARNCWQDYTHCLPAAAEEWIDRGVDRQTEEWTDTGADRQTEEWTDTGADGGVDRQRSIQTAERTDGEPEVTCSAVE